MEAEVTTDTKLDQQSRFVLKSLISRLADVETSLYRTRRDMVALAVLLNRRGVTIEEAEWEAAAQEIEAAHQIEMVFDPRQRRGEEFLARILGGEEIPEEEMNQWLRDVEEGSK
jgi:phosphopantetheine adenylyltransferase